MTASTVRGMRFRLPWQKSFPTLLHITHIKAGSTWIDHLLRELFGARVMPRFGSDLFRPGEEPPPGSPPRKLSYLEMFQATPFRAGQIYPAMFITRDEFRTRPEFGEAQRFIVIRDLRDTLTSHYFSLKGTHALDKLGRVQSAREQLQSASKDDGFRFLFDRDLERLVEIQRSWLAAGELVLRYEDLLQNDVAAFTRLFVETLALPVQPADVERAVAASRFESVFKRKLGELDENSHGRQGLPGDWRKHFSPVVRADFQSRVGDLLIAAGYEKDAGWVTAD